MAIEKSVLSYYTIKKIMLEEYGILIDTIKKIKESSANVFEMFSDSGHYILKEFQSKVNFEKIKMEYLVIEHLRKDGISTPQYVLNKKGKIYCEYNKKFLIVQKFIEGHTITFHASNQKQIIESVQMYGKIVRSLEDFPHELPLFKRHFMSKELCEKDIENIERILKSNKNKSVGDVLLHKKEILLKLKGMDYSWQDKLTYKKSHGDYTISQFIYNDDGKIEVVIDWVTARKIPIARELIRNYFFMSKELKKQRINMNSFLEYIKEFKKYQKLNYFDLKYMPLLYLIELSRTVFGYEQYINNGSKNYLKLGNELYNQCIFLEKNAEELSKVILHQTDDEICGSYKKGV